MPENRQAISEMRPKGALHAGTSGENPLLCDDGPKHGRRPRAFTFAFPITFETTTTRVLQEACTEVAP